MDDYYLALGRFIDRYAQAENALFTLLVSTANISLEAAQCLLSGTRTNAAISYIKRLYEAREREIPVRLAACFTQLNTITTVRDHILHTGAYSAPNGRVTSANLLRAHAKRTTKIVDASPTKLDEMAADLGTISAVLTIHTILHHDPTAFNSALSQRGRLYVDAQAPWQYTSG